MTYLYIRFFKWHDGPNNGPDCFVTRGTGPQQGEGPWGLYLLKGRETQKIKSSHNDYFALQKKSLKVKSSEVHLFARGEKFFI